MSESRIAVEAVILAGGLGSRLKTVVADRPKPLAEVHGRPFLGYILDQIAAAGIRHVVFSTGFMGDSIRDAFTHTYGPLRLTHAREDVPLGTGGGLRLAATHTAASTLLVLNGDSYSHVDLAHFLDDYAHHGAMPSLVLVGQNDTSRYGRVDIAGTGRVIAFHEKSGCCGPGWINAGIYAIPRSRVLALPPGHPLSLEKDVLPEWMKTGLRGYPCAGAFIDIGTPESYADAGTFFTRRFQTATSLEADGHAPS